MKRCYVSMTLILSMTCWAQNSSLNLAMPMQQQSYMSDRFRANELDCSNAIGGGTNLEFGVTGIISRNPTNVIDTGGLNSTTTINNGRVGDVGVYGRIIIPLDGPSERINCNTLYQLELTKKRIEVQKLQQELENLKKMQFEK